MWQKQKMAYSARYFQTVITVESEWILYHLLAQFIIKFELACALILNNGSDCKHFLF